MQDDYRAVLKLKRSLAHTWTPFFSRFGALLAPQVAAIPHVLAGENVFLSAATATGKTEAIVAPLAERLWGDNSGSLLCIYIAPTRALVNDVEKRCRPPLEEIGFSCRVRTGDRPEFKEHSPSQFVITTPESLDSLLSRKVALFGQVQAVILDELHLVDKTYRGDQLRILLNRLALVAQIRPQVCAASATMGDATEMANRYAVSPLVMWAGGNRDIEERYFSSLQDLAAHLIAQSRTLRKILFFANSRRLCEESATRLRGILEGWPVMAHHGSLARAEREEVERAMRESMRWACFATTTLEVGIDIGDVDGVCLLEPPLSVDSLLQRIGRANRRTGTVRAFALINSVDDEAIYHAQFDQARRGLLDKREYHPDLSVVVQQLFAVLASTGAGIDEDYLRKPFVDFCSPSQFETILAHLCATGSLRRTGSHIYAAEKIANLAERGSIYSNIASRRSLRIVDQSNGRAVGEVADVPDSTFALAGRAWTVVKFEKGTLLVRPTKKEGSLALFRPHPQEGAFAAYLPEELRLGRPRPDSASWR